METIKETVCINCKRILNKSVNLAELARLMEIHPSTISRWKSGDHAPELDKLDRMADILNIDVAEFFKTGIDRHKETSPSGLLRQMLKIPDQFFYLIGETEPTEREWGILSDQIGVFKEAREKKRGLGGDKQA